MTTLTWSSEQIQMEFSDCENLKQIITSVEDRMWRKGEVVCEIYVNGLVFREEDESRFSGSALEDIKELKVRSNRPEELVRQTLSSVNLFIPDLAVETDELAARYRGDSEDPSLQAALSTTLDGFRQLTDAIFLVRAQLENWPEVGELVDEWKRLEDKHAKALKDLITSLDGQDAVLIADVLEYDVSDILEDWRRIIPQVIDRLKDANMKASCSNESSS